MHPRSSPHNRCKLNGCSPSWATRSFDFLAASTVVLRDSLLHVNSMFAPLFSSVSRCVRGASLLNHVHILRTRASWKAQFPFVVGLSTTLFSLLLSTWSTCLSCSVPTQTMLLQVTSILLLIAVRLQATNTAGEPTDLANWPSCAVRLRSLQCIISKRHWAGVGP